MTYILRDVDLDLWRAFKARAHAEHWPLRALFEAFMRQYVAHGALQIQTDKAPEEWPETHGADAQ